MLPIIPFGAEIYTIPFAARLRGANSASFSKTNVAVPTNERIFTIVLHVKRGALGTASFQTLLGGHHAGTIDTLGFGAGTNNGGDFLQMRENGSGAYNLLSSAAFRDPTAHHQIVIGVDTTQATASERVHFWIDGVRLTGFSSAVYPALNALIDWNRASAIWTIGQRHIGSGQWFYDGLISDLRLIDGQRLPASTFGFPAQSGAWRPRRYLGLYGANGGWWRFADASAATPAAFGADSSSNGNHLTPSNVSVTAGPTFDQSRDTPSINHATLSPLGPGAAGLSNANLSVAGPTGQMRGTIGVASGAWVVEGQIVGFPDSANSTGFGIRSDGGETRYIRSRSADFACRVSAAGETTGLAFWSTNDIARIEFDIDGNRCAIYRNGALVQESLAAGLSGQRWWPDIQAATAGAWHLNFGARPWSHAPSAGYRGLSSLELAGGPGLLSGAFTGNASADGPVIWTGHAAATLTINGNAVIWGTHADRLAGGFKLRTASSSYNASGTNNWTATQGVPFASAARVPGNAQMN
ncbi:MAG: hypothetical protein NBV67_00710 [Tagaea sp.]|nr:hypothetical protein [Tagaea sp.]